MSSSFPARFVFLRHGETDYNRNRIIQGQLDIPLNALGRSQAAAHAALFATQPFDALVVSDLSRAVETAVLAAGSLGLSLQTDMRLRERNFGPHQNKPKSRDLWLPPEDDYESLNSFVARISDVLQENADRRLPLFVAHGGFLRAFQIAAATRLPAECFENAVPLLFVREREGGWTCSKLADGGQGE